MARLCAAVALASSGVNIVTWAGIRDLATPADRSTRRASNVCTFSSNNWRSSRTRTAVMPAIVTTRIRPIASESRAARGIRAKRPRSPAGP